jgi:hypothetical protein
MKLPAYKEEVSKKLQPLIKNQGQQTNDGFRKLNHEDAKQIADMLVDDHAERIVKHWHNEGAEPRFTAEQIAFRRSTGSDYEI